MPGQQTFRPSKGRLRMYLSESGNAWPQDAALAARETGPAGFSQMAPGATLSVIGLEGNIAGFAAEPEGEPGAINIGPWAHQSPLRADLWTINHFMSLLGAAATPVQLDSSTAYRNRIDAEQTDITWPTARALHYEFDNTGDLVYRFFPSWVQSWALSVASNQVAQSTWNIVSAQMNQWAGIFTIDSEAGTITSLPVLRGLPDETLRDVADAEQEIHLQVNGAPTGAGTVADPKVITFKAATGSTPSFGSTTFTVTCGTEPGEQDNPRWFKLIDSTSGSVLGMNSKGKAPLEIAILDEAGGGFSDTDQISTAQAATWTPSSTTEPNLTSVDTCLTLDGIEKVTLESHDIAIASDRQIVPGGICRSMSQAANREGPGVTLEYGYSAKWITDRIYKKIINYSQIAGVTTIDSGVEIDPGTSNETYKVTISTPNLRPSDGSTVNKTFPGGATDASETQGLKAHPDSSIGNASVRVDIIAAVPDPEA